MNTLLWSRPHPLVGYFALAYGITWGGILLVLASKGFDLATSRHWDKSVIVALMLLGPCVSGFALTAWLEGRAGLRDLWQRLAHWRVGWNWVAFALGLVAGCCEEIGWTGFATPRLLARRSAGVAGLQIGVLWAVWHAAADFSSNYATMGAAWWAWFSVFWLATLPAYRILMTWVYAHTHSLLLAILMHASYTGWLFVLYPATSLAQGLLWQGLLALGLWLAVFMVWLACDPGTSLGRQAT